MRLKCASGSHVDESPVGVAAFSCVLSVAAALFVRCTRGSMSYGSQALAANRTRPSVYTYAVYVPSSFHRVSSTYARRSALSLSPESPESKRSGFATYFCATHVRSRPPASVRVHSSASFASRATVVPRPSPPTARFTIHLAPAASAEDASWVSAS